jgi:hypothetical protein
MDLSVNESSARTVISLFWPTTAPVISALNGLCPPSWRATSLPFTHTVAR